MLELFLIRHAQSEANVRSHLIGGQQNNIDLTAKGEVQAQALGHAIHERKLIFDGIYASLAVRAWRTAEYACLLSRQTARMIEVPEIQERTQGDAENKPIVEVYTPELQAIIDVDPWKFKHKNGESMADVESRAMAFIAREFLMQKKTGRYALFTHGNLIKTVLAHAQGEPMPNYYDLRIANTSVTRLIHTGTEWVVGCVGLPFESAYK